MLPGKDMQSSISLEAEQLPLGQLWFCLAESLNPENLKG